MIKNHPLNITLHSSQSQKHSSAIISIDKKYAMTKKTHLSKSFLSPQQKNSILENGPLILQFINEKLQIVNQINNWNQKIIEISADDNKKNQIEKIEQNLQLIKSEILPRIEHELNTNQTCQQLNERIYSVLSKMSQIHLKTLKRLNQYNLQISKPKMEQNKQIDQKLKQYFYSFLISLAATQPQYHQFLEALYDELFFDSQFSAQKVETLMTQDTQYCIRILIIALTNKFQKLIEGSRFTQKPNLIYFPNQLNFLKLTFNFILINIKQTIDKLSIFINKFRTIQNLIQKIDYQANAQQKNENLKNTLSRYLPKQFQTQSINQPHFTFSPRDLKNLKYNMLKSYNIKSHLQQWTTGLSIFDHAFYKICFERILNCKRHNFCAAQVIFQTFTNCRIHKLFAFDGFKQIYDFSELTKQYQNRESQAKKDFNRKFLKKIFISWRNIKERKQKLLRQLIKRKAKTQKKQQTLIFNLWRINISRMRISEKILAHSSSCNALINKFTEEEIETFEQKKQKNVDQLQKSIQKMSGITLKRSNSFKSGLSQSRITKNQKPKNFNNGQTNFDQDLKLLNYQYKQSIIQKLKKKKRKTQDNSISIPCKNKKILQSKTLLKL